MSYPLRLIISLVTVFSLALSGCGGDDDDNQAAEDAERAQAQAQEETQRVQSELEETEERLRSAEQRISQAHQNMMRERERAQALEQRAQGYQRNSVTASTETQRLTGLVQELEMRIEDWRARARTGEMAAQELQAVRVRLHQSNEQLMAAREALRRYQERDQEREETEREIEEGQREIEEARRRQAERRGETVNDGAVASTPPVAAEPEAPASEPSSLLGTEGGAATEDGDETTTFDLGRSGFSDDAEGDAATAEEDVETELEEVTEICQTLTALETELQTAESASTEDERTEEEQAIIDTLRADIERITEENDPSCEATTATAPAPREVATVDGEDDVSTEESERIEELIERIETLSAEVAEGDARLEAFRQQNPGVDISTLPEQAQERIAALEAKRTELEGLEAELRDLVGVTDAGIDTEALIAQSREFLENLSEQSVGAEDAAAEVIEGLGEDREVLRADVARLAEEVRGSNLDEATQQLLVDRLSVAYAEIESSPEYLMARLEMGDLQEQSYPFLLTAYGMAESAGVAELRQLVEQSAMAQATGLAQVNAVAASEDAVFAFTQEEIENSNQVIFYHRHLVQGDFEQLSALVQELEMRGAMVSIKPLEMVEVDTYLSWAPSDREARETHSLRVLLNTQETSLGAAGFTGLGSAAEVLGAQSECASVTAECFEKLKELELLQAPSAAPATLAEKAAAVMDLVLSLSSGMSDSDISELESMPGHEVLQQLLGEERLTEYLAAVQADSADPVMELRLESHLWATQEQSMTEDPLSRDLVEPVTRQQIREGESSYSLASGRYILEDSQARYYFLPVVPVSTWGDEASEEDASDLRQSLVESLRVVLAQ